jgi:rhamnulokinase
VAGPAEATALGNVLVQARALGTVPATLPGMRAILRSCLELRTFAPSGGTAVWESAANRVATAG